MEFELGNGDTEVVTIATPVNVNGMIFEKTDDAGACLSPGDELTYTISWENPGEVTVTDLVIVDYLPNTLFDLIRGSTTSAERISYTLQLLSALSYLDRHNPSVVHRDIKPRNIFIKGKSCVLGDFGLMKILDAQDEVDHQVYIESVGTGMPFFYRTPDLIAYAKERRPLSTKSDVFQLGLVTAQAFTGWNPQKKTETFTDDLTLEPIRYIPGTLGPRIKELIENMLTNDPTTRPSANDLIDPWEGIFREVVEQCQRLEGRVF